MLIHCKLKNTRIINPFVHIDSVFLILIIILLTYSAMVIWSASGQNIIIMEKKIFQILIGFAIMIIMSYIPPYIYEKSAPYLYILCLILLILVKNFGHVIKGAQRWLNIGMISFQPSEIAKIIIPLMVAYLINQDTCPPKLKKIIISLILIIIPTFLVAIQPDLGTAILIAISGFFVLYLSGMSWKFIGISFLIIIIFTPVLWFDLLHEYQRDRIIMLFNPDLAPLGAGYHITQSKIAIGSGGLLGKGWLHGTQSQLNFLPESHTDFIFAVLAEEFGLIGVLLLIILYLLLIIRGLIIASQAQTAFGRIVAGNIILILFVYIFINIAMVSGIIPVVGIPLPFMSYGGSSMVVLMAGFGIMMSIHSHKKCSLKISK